MDLHIPKKYRYPFFLCNIWITYLIFYQILVFFFSLIKLDPASSLGDSLLDNELRLRLYFLFKQNLIFSSNWYWSTYIVYIFFVVNNLRLCCQIMYTSIVTIWICYYLHICMTRNCTVYVNKKIYVLFCTVNLDWSTVNWVKQHRYALTLNASKK